jgi:hypothetical protein
MARVVGLHEIELRPGTDPTEFERVAAEVVSLPMFEGWTTRLLKGERGARAGKYLLVFEIVDQEARDRYFRAEHQGSDEIGRSEEQNRQAADAWERLHALGVDSDITTDYVVVAE